MATGSADGFFRYVDGCLSGADTGIQRRPYHRNCKCALHRSKGDCPHGSKSKNVSYPIRRSWSEGCLALAAVSSCHSSPSSSPSVQPLEIRRSGGGGGGQLGFCEEDEFSSPLISPSKV